jgi:hypothetical protein
MRISGRLTVAVAGLAWTALTYGAFFAIVLPLGPFLDRLPRMLQTALTLGAVAGLTAYVPPAFPWWRARLTVDDRRRLFAGSGGGAVIGLLFGSIIGLAILEPDFTRIGQSTRSETVLWTFGVVSGLVGAYLTTRTLSLFAPPAPPRLDGPIASDGTA